MEYFDFSNISSTHGAGFITKVFLCPNCHGLTFQNWKYDFKHQRLLPKETEYGLNNVLTNTWVIHAICGSCNNSSFWLKNQIEELLIFPIRASDIPAPNPDMPQDVLDVYQEAASVIDTSARASAALSRLAIDYLTKHLDSAGDSLNKRIGNLVSKGLPVMIQQSLDAVRVIGNNAVHPGSIDFSDGKDIALSLLGLINLICDNQITQPKQIKELYNSLPESSINAISKRDGKV